MDGIGTSLLQELYDCDPSLLNDGPYVTDVIGKAAVESGAKIISKSYRVVPHGVTATAFIAESHITVGTWPEKRYAAVDIFFCGKMDPYKAAGIIHESLKAQRSATQEIRRGIGIENANVSYS